MLNLDINASLAGALDLAPVPTLSADLQGVGALAGALAMRLEFTAAAGGVASATGVLELAPVPALSANLQGFAYMAASSDGTKVLLLVVDLYVFCSVDASFVFQPLVLEGDAAQAVMVEGELLNAVSFFEAAFPSNIRMLLQLRLGVAGGEWQKNIRIAQSDDLVYLDRGRAAVAEAPGEWESRLSGLPKERSYPAFQDVPRGSWAMQPTQREGERDLCPEMGEEIADDVYHSGAVRPVRRVDWDVCRERPPACAVADGGWLPAAASVQYPKVFLQTNLKGQDCIPVNRLVFGAGTPPLRMQAEAVGGLVADLYTPERPLQWSDVDSPDTFPPEEHTHVLGDILQSSGIPVMGIFSVEVSTVRVLTAAEYEASEKAEGVLYFVV
jgi:hypothetical protein